MTCAPYCDICGGNLGRPANGEWICSKCSSINDRLAPPRDYDSLPPNMRTRAGVRNAMFDWWSEVAEQWEAQESKSGWPPVAKLAAWEVVTLAATALFIGFILVALP